MKFSHLKLGEGSQTPAADSCALQETFALNCPVHGLMFLPQYVTKQQSRWIPIFFYQITCQGMLVSLVDGLRKLHVRWSGSSTLRSSNECDISNNWEFVLKSFQANLHWICIQICTRIATCKNTWFATVTQYLICCTFGFEEVLPTTGSSTALALHIWPWLLSRIFATNSHTSKWRIVTRCAWLWRGCATIWVIPVLVTRTVWRFKWFLMLQAFTARSKCSKSQVICLRAACHDGDGWSCFEERLSSKAGIKGLSKFVIQAVWGAWF